MSDVYYQFPLCLFSVGHEHNRLFTIKHYCAVSVGWPIAQKLVTKKEKADFVEGFTSPKPSYLSHSDQYHLALLAGFQHFGIHGGNAVGCVSDYEEAAKHINEMFGRFGQSPIVRLRSDLIWAPHREEMTYRQVSVAAAVFSSIGGKKFPWQITRDAIRARAMGYKAASVLFDDKGNLTDAGRAVLEKREDKAQPLTVDQVRWTLDELEARGWFHRCHASKRRTYFSHRMTREQMLAWFKQNPPASKKVAKFRKQDAKLRAQTGSTYYSGDSGGSYYSGDDAGTNSDESPRNPQSTPSESPVSPHDHPHERPHNNRIPLIEPSLKEGERAEGGAGAPSLSPSDSESGKGVPKQKLKSHIEKMREAVG